MTNSPTISYHQILSLHPSVIILQHIHITTQLPNETSLINDLPSTLNQQPTSSIFIPSTPNSPQTSPVTDSVTDHLNSSSDIRLNAVEIVSSDGLRDFFAKLLESQTPTRQRKNGRKRLTGLGESLPSDEAMEIMRKEEEEKRRLEQEKAEKRKKREELRMKKKEEKMKKNGKGKRGIPKKSKTNDDDDDGDDDENEDNDITTMNCPACKGSYHDDKVWLECEFCHHADCAGYSGWIKEDLQLETFFCSSCI